MRIVADESIPYVGRCFSSLGKVVLLPAGQIDRVAVAGADVLLVRSVTRVNEALVGGSGVRFVGTATIGFDHIDLGFLRRCGIGFASAPGSNANSVAEYVAAALLEVAESREIVLDGQSIGIIGVGNVGSRVAQKAERLGMRVLLNDPPLARQICDERYLAIEELFDCDFITLHTPLTFTGADKTFHLADERFFDSLKNGCVFLNSSRGAVADTKALKEAIERKQLQAAVVDVWENEPDIDCELMEIADIGTPHIAGYSLDGRIAGMITIYQAVCRYFGLEMEHSPESFLPAPMVPRLHVDCSSGGQQAALRKAVKSIYDIGQDDANLRRMLEVPVGRRGAYFSRLRREYPVRREFHNTQVVVDGCCGTVGAKLAGIGFSVAEGP